MITDQGILITICTAVIVLLLGILGWALQWSFNRVITQSDKNFEKLYGLHKDLSTDVAAQSTKIAETNTIIRLHTESDTKEFGEIRELIKSHVH